MNMLNVLTNPAGEELVPLNQVPTMDSSLIPRARAGRKIAVSTIYRWATRGCRGVKLEVLRAGGVTCTTRAALLRFYESVTRMSMGTDAASPRPPAQRILANVDRQLDSIFDAKET
jgi:hypothetical protein